MSTDVDSTSRGKQLRLPLTLVELALRKIPPFVGSRAIAAGLRLAGANVAGSAAFWGMPTLVGPGDVASRLTIGELCGLNYGCFFELEEQITLEEHVAVGHEVMFLTRVRVPSELGPGVQVAGAKPIRIEKGCWLGARATIMPGVTVGAGSVIGAQVVVRSDVPPNTLLAGSRKISIAKWR